MVYGFYDGGQIMHSPLKQTFPNASGLMAGRSYRVKLSFCRTKTPERATSTRRAGGASAHAAKVPCDRRTFTSLTRRRCTALRASGLSSDYLPPCAPPATLAFDRPGAAAEPVCSRRRKRLDERSGAGASTMGGGRGVGEPADGAGARARRRRAGERS